MTHTTDLELSKELYKLGLRIETEYYWEDFKLVRRGLDNSGRVGYTQFSVPAYSTDELLAVLPKQIESFGYFDLIISYPGLKRVEVSYIKYGLNDDNKLYQIEKMYYINRDNLPQALGLMAKWLLQNVYHYDKERKVLWKTN